MLTIELPFIGVLALAEASDGSQGLIDLPLVLWTGVTFVIVLFTLKQFAWGPILEQLERREGAIRGAIEGAERERGEAAGLREQYEQRLQGSREEGQVLIEEAREYGAIEVPAALARSTARVSGARAKAAQRLGRARGESEAFEALLAEYRQNPEVVSVRLYRESIERALAPVTKRFVPPPSGERYENLRITIPF